jgi:hypothetical protein
MPTIYASWIIHNPELPRMILPFFRFFTFKTTAYGREYPEKVFPWQ